MTVAQTYWTRERVINGLRRFARDYFEGRESELPARPHNYRFAIPPEDARIAKRLRLYPDFSRVLRYFPSMIDAWKEIGFDVKPTERRYWTRERVIEGLKRFYEDFGFLPTEQKDYHSLSAFSPRHDKRGRRTPNGAYGKYPSWNTARRFFPTMRSAWESAGFEVDHGFEPWSEIEDWWVLESVGILPQQEAAAYIRRTGAAVKRRLYDLGRINSKNRWGITVNAVAVETGLTYGMVTRYLEWGVLPFFRGLKSLYINPADLLKIEDFDWASLDPDSRLYQLIRLSLIQRALKIMKFGAAWREHEIYRIEQTRHRRRVMPGEVKTAVKTCTIPPPPNDLRKGDWVTTTVRLRMVEEGRLGVIKSVFYSAPRFPRADGSKRAAWMAGVEFPKLRKLTPGDANRVRYNLPLDRLVRTEKPERSIEYKQTPEAIRSRERRGKYVNRAGDRFEAIRQEIS